MLSSAKNTNSVTEVCEHLLVIDRTGKRTVLAYQETHFSRNHWLFGNSNLAFFSLVGVSRYQVVEQVTGL